MSKINDGFDYDFFPNQPSQEQALFGTLTTIGDNPDLITALVPVTRDVLLLGGNSSVYIMRGDPGTGGYFDQVTDESGMAYGMPWC